MFQESVKLSKINSQHDTYLHSISRAESQVGVISKKVLLRIMQDFWLNFVLIHQC